MPRDLDGDRLENPVENSVLIEDAALHENPASQENHAKAAYPSGRNIKLRIAYDGTDFAGWQRQERNDSIQGRIEKALATIHHAPVRLTGSGRTDAGVHALGQVANFYTTIAGMEAERFVPALNSLLPHTIRILDACEVPADFHARFDAKYRTYRYQFICGREPFPQELRYVHPLRQVPRLRVLNEYARLLHGELDCTFFSLPRDTSASRHRYFYEAAFYMERGLLGDTLVFQVRANAFLWRMVRIITGTFILYERQDIPACVLHQRMINGDRSLAGPILPAAGLFLVSIGYYGNPTLF